MLSGSKPDQSFITGASSPVQIAVNDAYLYWTNFATNAIGRARVDGSNVDQSLIIGADGPAGVAVDPPDEVTARKTQTRKGMRIRVKVKVSARDALPQRPAARSGRTPPSRRRQAEEDQDAEINELDP